jgi:two-component system, NarL family, sensor kinase
MPVNKKITLLFIVFNTGYLTSNAQFDKNNDSLIANLVNYPAQDSNRVKALIKITSGITFLKQKKEVLPYQVEAEQLSRKLNFRYGKVFSYSWMGHYYKSMRSYDTALLHLDSGVVMAEGVKEERFIRERAIMLSAMAQIYYQKENYSSSIKYAEEAMLYFEKNFSIATNMLSRLLSNIYMALGNDVKAIEYLKKQISYKKYSNSTIIYGDDAYIDLADIYLKKDKLAEARRALDSIKKIMPDTIQVMMTYAYYQKEGIYYSKMKMYSIALENFKKAIFYAATGNHINALSATKVYLAEAALNNNDPHTAAYIADAAAYVVKEGSINHRYEILRIQAALNYKKGNLDKAYQQLATSVLIKDSLISETNLKQVNTLSAFYENEKKDKEIQNLDLQNKLNTVELKQNSLANKILIAAVLLLTLLGILLFANLQSRKKIQQQKITELEKNKQIMAVDAMLKGQEEERSRIAKELHDGLGGMLSGVKLSLTNMKEYLVMTPDLHSGFERSVDQLDTTISELRKISQNLMPDALIKLGLKEALNDFCSQLRISTGKELQFEMLGVNRQLDNTGSLNVYRIVQELINNAVKHANATQLLVQVTLTNEKTLITVEDNGIGFDTKSTTLAKGVGLNSIKQRVDYFKGKLEIESNSGKGTSVNIELHV